MHEFLPNYESPIQEWSQMGDRLGVHLLIKRDDLLPFPLSGNKYRKLLAEYREKDWQPGDFLISNGGVDSNHCRTLAWFGALLGCDVHVVLHDDFEIAAPDHVALRLLLALGASYEIVHSSETAVRVEGARDKARSQARRVWVVPGGAHTRAGVRAIRESARKTLVGRDIDVTVLASGTGATQAGIILGARDVGDGDVIGVSVARDAERGAGAVRECLEWFGAADLRVRFDDRYLDGGYSRQESVATLAAVNWAWSQGLPLDGTYTGKAFNGLRQMIQSDEISKGSRVLFWHTGGLMNWLSSGHPG